MGTSALGFRLLLGSAAHPRHPGAVSLNRYEEALLRYLRAHPDEHRFWHAHVLAVAQAPAPLEDRLAQLERGLRDYAAERARADTTLADDFGAGQIRLRNLAELLVATWPPPRPIAKKPAR